MCGGARAPMMLVRVSVSRWRCWSIELARRWRQPISVRGWWMTAVMVCRWWCRRRGSNHRWWPQGRQVRHRRCVMHRRRGRGRSSIYMARGRALLTCRPSPIAVCWSMRWRSRIGVRSWRPGSKGMIRDKRRRLHRWRSRLGMTMSMPCILCMAPVTTKKEKCQL